LKNSTQNYDLVIFVSAAAIVSILLSFLIETQILRIVFTSSFFILLFLLQFYLFFAEPQKHHYKSLASAKVSQIAYGLAILSSFMILWSTLPEYHVGLSLMTFTSLNMLEIIRVVLGYYMLTVFPGYIAHRAFLIGRTTSLPERLSLVLAISYIVNTTLGFLLNNTFGLSPLNILFALWLFALACEGLRYVRDKHATIMTESGSNSIMKVGLIVGVCSILVFSSYFITLSAEPTDFSLGGDIARYISGSNAFLAGQPIEAVYIWFQAFIGIASLLTGLHPLYAFVGMQFLIILYPLSFYTLLMKVFKDDRIATVGVVITTITGGLSSIGILRLLPTYETDMLSALSTLCIKTKNWPWLSNHFFIAATMDYSLLMLSLGYLYSFTSGKESGKTGNLILGSLFLASAFFTHNIPSLLLSFMIMVIFSVSNYKYLKRVALASIVTLSILLALDTLSNRFFFDTLLNYYVHYQVFFAHSTLFNYQQGVIVLASTMVLVMLIPGLSKAIHMKTKHVNLSKHLVQKSLFYACIVLSLASFLIPLVLVFACFDSINLAGENIFPWYIYLLRFTPFLQLAILSIPFLLEMERDKRQGVWFMASWAISAIPVTCLNIFFPRFAESTLTNRLLMSIYLPLGASSALTLNSLREVKLPEVKVRLMLLRKLVMQTLGKINIKTVLISLLMVTIGFSYLSYVYSVEIFYRSNTAKSMSNEEKNLYEYLHNLPTNSTFLTYSHDSYVRISSLAGHKVYAYYQYGKSTLWSAEILFRSLSPEVTHYFLHKLGITHIVLTKQDLNAIPKDLNSSLMLMLKFFPIILNNSFATVYSVPTYLLQDSSNYVIIKPTTKITPEIVSQSLIYGNIGYDNLRVVGGSCPTFKVEGDTIIQELQNIKQPSAQYLQLYRGVAVPTDEESIVSFKVRGTENALFNLGFYDHKKGWYWLTKEKGLPTEFITAPKDWTEVKIVLNDLLGDNAVIRYIDFVATSSDGSAVRVEWKNFRVFRNVTKAELALKAYNIGYSSLMANNVPFTIVQDYENLTLTPNYVFVFPSCLIDDEEVYNGLLRYVKSGAHAIFLYEPEFVLDYSSNKSVQRLMDLLGIKVNDVTSADKVHINGEITNLPPDLYVAQLVTESSPYSFHTMGYYMTSENTSVPLILNLNIGNGSIMFINWPKSSFLDRPLASIATKAMKTIIAALPKPASMVSLRTLPYPEDLFKLSHAYLLNLYKLKGLANYVYAFSDLKLEGNITMSSDFINWCEENIPTGKLILRGSTGQEHLEGVSITSIRISGFFDVMLTAQKAFVSNLGGELANIEISFPKLLRINVQKAPIHLVVNENGTQRNLTISKGNIEVEFDTNFITHLQLRKPLITLDTGLLDTSWKGVFWHDEKIFTTVSRNEYWMIKGSFSFNIIYCDNITVIKLIHIGAITVVLNENN